MHGMHIGVEYGLAMANRMSSRARSYCAVISSQSPRTPAGLRAQGAMLDRLLPGIGGLIPGLHMSEGLRPKV